MPNSKHLVKCPFFEYEKTNFIKCEDVKRTFRWIKQKDNYMYRFCDESWMKCEYALRLHHAYEEGRDMEEVKIESMKSELRKLERRLKASEERNKAKDNEIKKLKKERKYLQTYREKFIAMRAKEDKIAKEIAAMTSMYEARFAYLMAEYADGVLDETDMHEWSKDKEFAIIPDKMEEDKVVQWRTIVRLKDDQDDNTTESEDKEEQSADHSEPEDRETDDSPKH